MLAALKAWLIAAHAFPLAAVMALTTLIAFASSDGAPDATGLALLLVAMLGSQLAIGWSNDYLDRESDAMHQPWKPVAQGLVEAAKLPPAIVAALSVSAVAGLVLGWDATALLVVGTSAGLAYNLWLKRTPLSGLPFVVALGVLPPFVWAALDVYQDDFFGLYLVATPLAIAAHLANVLPDLESDRAQGRKTLAVWLGPAASVALLAVCMLIVLPLTLVAGISFVEYETELLVPVLAVYVVLAAVAVLLSASGVRRSSRERLVWAFRCVVIATVMFVGGWLAAVA
jgi:4-hydroxybenzoate polyprenyltransferase